MKSYGNDKSISVTTNMTLSSWKLIIKENKLSQIISDFQVKQFENSAVLDAAHEHNELPPLPQIHEPSGPDDCGH